MTDTTTTPLSTYADAISQFTAVHPVPAGYAFRFDTPADPQDETGIYLTTDNGQPCLQDDGILWATLETCYDVPEFPDDHSAIKSMMDRNGIRFDRKSREFILSLPSDPASAALLGLTFQTVLRCISALAHTAGPATIC